MKPEFYGRRSAALLVLLAVVLFWVHWTPDRPQRLYHAVSPHAQLVSQHESLGSRIDLLSTNAAVRAALFAAGVKPKRIRKWREKPQTRFWLEQLLFDRAILIHEPILGNQCSAGWVAVSWIGSRQARLRMASGLLGLDDYEKLGRYRGRTLWLSSDSQDRKQKTVLALAEGIVVAVHHPDPYAIEEVLDRLDGLRPRLQELKPEWFTNWEARGGRRPDRSLFLLDGPEGRQPLYLRMDQLTPQDLTLCVEGEMVNRLFAAPPSPKAASLLSRLGGDADRLLEGTCPPLPGSSTSAWNFTLLGSPLHSRVSFFRVPSLLLAGACPSESQAEAELDALRAVMTKRFGVRFQIEKWETRVPAWSCLPDLPMRASWWKAEECPAACLWGESLVVCSSRRVLERLLAHPGGDVPVDLQATVPGEYQWLKGSPALFGEFLAPLLSFRQNQLLLQGESSKKIEDVGTSNASFLAELQRLPVLELNSSRRTPTDVVLQIRLGTFEAGAAGNALPPPPGENDIL